MRNTTLLIGAKSAQRNPVSKGEEFFGDRPRGIAALALVGLFGLLNSVACGSSSSTNEDAGHADTSADRQQVTDTGVVPDASTPVGLDAPVNASVDAFVDAPVNASVDAPVNASVDAPENASVDAPIDAFVGAPVDASACTLVGQTLCADGVCHDLMNEDSNCGWCGSQCSLDKQCISGQCACIVPGTCPL